MDAGSHLASWALAAPHIPRAGIFTHQLLNFSQMQKILSEIYMNALNYGASLIDQLVKNPPVMWETWVRSLGWEDPLEKGKTTHFSILTWEFHGLCSPRGRKDSDTTERLSLA